MAKIVIRKAEAGDASIILGFIRELAVYEKAEHEVVATEDDIERTLLTPGSSAGSLICEKNGKAVGFAVYFLNYSTWQGKYGIYLEDLYVSPSERGGGCGKAMLKYLAQEAVEKDYGRFEWSVLDWNEPSIKVYESIGAEPLNEWIRYRLDGRPLKDLAAS